MLNRRQTRHSLLLCGAAAIALATAGMADAAEAAKFDIPAQPLSTALAQFGVQSQHGVFADSALTSSLTTRGVSGDKEAEVALNELLAGTGLSWKRDGQSFIVMRASDPQSGSAAGDGAEGTVQALIVTAQKREENIQDVPIAMSAFTQEDLTRSQVAGGPDLMTQVPNFTFTKTNFTGYSIQIRGIGTQAISATTDAAVAVAFNNTPFIRNRFFEQEFYDLQRVEVLRGPQGTLYGRNATAGVVNIISAKPSFHYEAKLSADVGNYNSQRLEGMVNVPLVDDKVALRVAGAWTKRDGYDTNQVTGNRIDGRDLWSTRVSLRIAPTDRLETNLIWEHFKEDDDRLRSGKQLCHTDEVTNVAGFQTNHYQRLAENGQSVLFSGVQATFSQGCAPASIYAPESFQTPNGLSLPYYGPLSMVGVPLVGGGLGYIDPYLSRNQSTDLRTIESTVDPQYQAESNLVEIQTKFDLTDKLSLTSETGYNSDTLFSLEDYNRFSTAPGIFLDNVDGTGAFSRNDLVKGGVFCDPQIGCANRLVAVDVSTAKSRQFSQEFRLASSFDGPFNFSLGANFLRYDTEDKYYVFVNTLSLYALMSPYAAQSGRSALRNGALPDYTQNVSDNHECLIHGMEEPDPSRAQTIGGCEYVDPNPIGSLNDLGHNYFLSKNPYKLISYAVFGEAYYNITPALKLTAGLRWTVDKKEAPRIPSWILSADNVGYPVAEVVKQEWREPTGRVTLDWKPDLSFTDETLLYGSYAHGYKAGGMNPPAAGVVCPGTCDGAEASALIGFSAAHPKTFDPEFVNAFEVGSKNTLLDGRLTLNSDAFYYDYTGYQISEIVDRSAVNLNFDAKIWGAEFEADWRPVENLRLGLKLGYERTRVADGSKAIDLMDRTAGNKDWVLVRPFPTFASNCVLPAWLFVGNAPDIGANGVISNPGLVNVGSKGGGGMGGCEFTYVLGRDPATGRQYFAFPYQNPDPNDPDGSLGPVAGAGFRTNINYAGWSTDIRDYPCWPSGTPIGNQYPGVDPHCLAALSNNGAGFYKDLSGKEFPNAPHITATLTADYTLPLPSNWLMTLHGDVYYQSEAWTRIFNTAGYDKLKAYNNVNLAAIFANEDAGWKIMAYVKNVFDKSNITGAFLNSDDTGLTTNVFLNEPRLYGLRVTKEWTGGPWWTGANPNHAGPYPLTIELSGQVQKLQGRYGEMTPSWYIDPATGDPVIPANLSPTGVQNRRFDWGDGREAKITYRPTGAQWMVTASVRYGRTNTGTDRLRKEALGDTSCRLLMTSPFGKALCDPTYSLFGATPGRYYNPYFLQTPTNWTDASANTREEHSMADFGVGRDVGMGALGGPTVGLGVRYAAFSSNTHATVDSIPDWNVPDGWFKYEATHDRFSADLAADRKFKGFGPTVSVQGANKLLGSDETGHVSLDWSVAGGVLFGKQRTKITGLEQTGSFSAKYRPADPENFVMNAPTPVGIYRAKSVSAPVLDLSLGLSYDIQRIKVGAGYRWERYYNVLDGGFAERKQYDRTIDGPYFKIAVGFGG